MSFSSDGLLLATTSDQGTVIRVHSIPQASKVKTSAIFVYTIPLFIPARVMPCNPQHCETLAGIHISTGQLSCHNLLSIFWTTFSSSTTFGRLMLFRHNTCLQVRNCEHGDNDRPCSHGELRKPHTRMASRRLAHSLRVGRGSLRQTTCTSATRWYSSRLVHSNSRWGWCERRASLERSKPSRFECRPPFRVVSRNGQSSQLRAGALPDAAGRSSVHRCSRGFHCSGTQKFHCAEILFTFWAPSAKARPLCLCALNSRTCGKCNSIAVVYMYSPVLRVWWSILQRECIFLAHSLSVNNVVSQSMDMQPVGMP